MKCTDNNRTIRVVAPQDGVQTKRFFLCEWKCANEKMSMKYTLNANYIMNNLLKKKRRNLMS